MQNTQNTVTLFSRYKQMINKFWDSGLRDYKAKDLNDWVGMYEQSSWWKRANNSPYYTTRTYQSQLRQLGCVTMIKRGLWKINGPIPEWFGSFHFNGLKGNLSDPSNFYWHQLPAMHKVNPWAKQKVAEQPQPATSSVVKPNVQTNIEQRIAAMESYVNEQTERLQVFKNALTELQALVNDYSAPVIGDVKEHSVYQWEVTYDDQLWYVIRTINGDDVFDEHWVVKDVYQDYAPDYIAEYLIKVVKESRK